MAPDFDDLISLHNERSEQARKTDEALKAEIAPDMETWMSEPNNYDWPGVDTPAGGGGIDSQESNDNTQDFTRARFTDIEGVGQKTADALQDVGTLNRPDELTEFESGDLASKAGISQDAAERAISGVGGDPSVGLFESIVGDESDESGLF